VPDASAQEAPAVPAAPGIVDLSEPDVEGPQRKPIPSITLAFEDPVAGMGLRGDCDAAQARLGRCVEFVGLVDSPTDPDDDTAREVGLLYAQLHDELALRWARADDATGLPVLQAGFTDAGLPAEQWTRSATPDGAMALPAKNGWLGPQALLSTDGLFPPVDWVQPDALEGRVQPLPPLARLTGRFAVRLGKDGEPYQHDLMEGDERSSGPFFEQMYPYSAERSEPSFRQVDAPVTPLQPFQMPERVLDALEGRQPGEPVALPRSGRHDWPVLVPPDLSIDLLHDRVHRQFEDFSRLISVTVASYAMRDHTLNQMRVLTALTAMARHPTDDGLGDAATSRLVAAARGETDADEDVLADLDRTAYALGGGVRLRVEVLPPRVLSVWLERLNASYPADEAELVAWQKAVAELTRKTRRPDAAPIANMREATIDAWVAVSMEAGAAREQVSREIQLLTLRRYMDRLDAPRRDQIETWILLDHVHDDLHERMSRLGADRVSPDDVTALGQTAWQTVLESHGHISQPVLQGRRAVDPTAICTTKPGRDALMEPSFGAVNLDLVVLIDESNQRASTPAKVLDQLRDQSPFLFVDDPADNTPSVSRLVDVPGSRAIYRVRWRVWTGWHLLWGVQPVAADLDRVVPWTAAICEDMVLAPPDLVPTLTRAGLLEGRMFPTEPVTAKDVRTEDRKAARQARQARKGSPEQQEAAADKKGEKLRERIEKAVDTVRDVDERGVGAAQTATDSHAAERSLEGMDTEDSFVVVPGSAAARYLQEVIRGALVTPADRADGALVYAFHLDRSTGRPQRSGIRPHTPYATVAHRPERGAAVRTSGWAVVIEPTDRVAEGQLPDVLDNVVAPAYRSTDQLAVEEQLRPDWRRTHPFDWTLSGSMGGFPLRTVRATCNVQDEDLDVLAPCSADAYTFANSEGFSTDISAYMTWWWLDRPRLALEWGLETHLDLVRPGPTRLFPSDDRTDTIDTVQYGWTFRPTAGVMVGLRHAPPPRPLHSRRPDGTLWGVQGSDSPARTSRTQSGIRAGALFGPSYNGTEATVVTELWHGWAVRRRQGPRATLTPYHPALLVGPYMRGQVAWLVPGLELLDDGQPRYLQLDRSVALLMGVRVHVRVNQKATPPAIQ